LSGGLLSLSIASIVPLVFLPTLASLALAGAVVVASIALLAAYHFTLLAPFAIHPSLSHLHQLVLVRLANLCSRFDVQLGPFIVSDMCHDLVKLAASTLPLMASRVRIRRSCKSRAKTALFVASS